MTNETALTTRQDVFEIIESAFGAMQFDNLEERINWSELRETIDPRGLPRKATDLTDMTFTITKIKPVHSSYSEGVDHFYWVVGLDENGERFNTALGGAAVVEELDAWLRLNYELYQAQERSDEETVSYCLARGAGKPITVTLRWSEGGRHNGYWSLD